MPASPPLGGILLTGGASRRFGVAKATLRLDGTTLAERTAGELAEAAGVLIEVGDGLSGLPAVRESPSGAGPLVAVVAGRDALAERGYTGAVLVVACDLPFVSRQALRALGEWPGGRSVVPVVEGRPQPLCARWSAADLQTASLLVERGARRLGELMAATDPDYVDVTGEEGPLNAHALADVDSAEQAEGYGVVFELEGDGGGG